MYICIVCYVHSAKCQKRYNALTIIIIKICTTVENTGSASHTVAREFAFRPGHTKDHHKNDANCLPAWHSRSALSNSYPNACMPMQGGSLYPFYDDLWYDPAERRTHDLPCERR